MLDTDDGWSIPTSSTLPELADEIDIIVDAKAVLPEKLTLLNSITRKKGLRPFQEPDHFNTFFSSICHYQSAAESLQDQIWDLMKRAMKQHFKENVDVSLPVLKRSSFLLCKLMDETIKKSIDGKKAPAVLEDRFENCCTYLQKLLKRIARLEKDMDRQLAQLTSGICWEAMRTLKKNKAIRTNIVSMIGSVAQCLGNEEISINIIKLIRKDENLGEFFAEAIESWTKTEQVHNLVRSIIQEMANVEDTSAQKGLVTLLQSLGGRIPQSISQSWAMLEELILVSDVRYWAREAVLGSIAEIYKDLELNGDPEVLGNEISHLNMSQVDALDDSTEEELGLKEKCFRKLTAHLHDKNSFVRSFTLQLFKGLSTTVRLPVVGEYLTRIVGRFDDKAALVRKSAIQSFVSLLNQSQLLDQIRKIGTLKQMLEEIRAEGPDREISTNEKTLAAVIKDCDFILDLVNKASAKCLRLLRSEVQGDTRGAIKYFYQITAMGIQGADLGGFRQMAVYVWSKDNPIKEEVLTAYKDVYFNDQRTGKETAIALIYLVKNCSEAEANSLGKLIQEIGMPSGAQQDLWKFATNKETHKLSNDTLRAAALKLINYLSKNASNDILHIGNQEILQDLILDETAGPLVLIEICKIFMLLRPDPKQPMQNGALPKDHTIFTNISKRINQFIKKPDSNLTNVTINAIKLFFHIGAAPTLLVTELLSDLWKFAHKSYNTATPRTQVALFSSALHAAGQAALHLTVFVECTLLPKITANMNKKKTKNKKSKDEDEIDDIFGSADNVEETRELYMELLENELTRGPFDKILQCTKSILMKIARGNHKVPEQIQNAAVISLAKFMLTSQKIAEENASLLFTILDRAELVSVVSSIIAVFPDLLVRHPNVVEPWTKEVFKKLGEDSVDIKRNCLRMVTELIVKGLIKPRGKLADIAMLLLDEDQSIETEARSFFVEFGSEGNHLFNQLPDILANLHAKDMPESDFRVISEFLFEQLQSKDKQIELIVEKLCLKFTEDDPQAWSQVALTISVMSPSEKGIKKMIEMFGQYKDKLENLELRDFLLQMPQKAKANTKLYNKAKESVDELEMLLNGDKQPDQTTPKSPGKRAARNKAKNMPKVKTIKPRTTRGKPSKRQAVWSDSDDDQPSSSDSEKENEPQVQIDLATSRSSRRRGKNL